MGTMTILLNLRDTGYNDNIIKSPRHWVQYYKISETLGTMTILLNLRDTGYNDNIIKSPRQWVQTILLNLRDTVQ